MAAINKKDYLKKYLSKGIDKKKKKKKKVPKGIIQSGMKIIDDNVDVQEHVQTMQDIENDNEDAPQVVAVIDERPIELRMENFKDQSAWTTIDITNEPQVKKEPEDSPDQPNGTSRDDNSPPRRRREQRNENNDYSPERRQQRSVNDNSPHRKTRHSRNNDNSPPRKRHFDTKSGGDDNSPPRRQKHKGNENYSPPRRQDKSRNASKDHSPPRKRNKEGHSPAKRNRSDISPPRRSKPQHNHDNSSPRRNRNASPPRRPTDDRNNRDSTTKPSTSRKSRWGSQERTEKATKTLDGKAAGLQNAKDLVQETENFRKREAKLFESMSTDVSGANASTVIRDRKTGKVRNLEEEAQEKSAQKQKSTEIQKKYEQWGKGVKQVEDHKEKLEQDVYEMTKPLARYADDADLEKYLKDQERTGDPMLAYIRKKKKDDCVAAGVKLKPEYEGEFMPNRYSIRPGHRWDGVDRSNGYEKKWFDAISKREAQREEAYRWNSEDM